MIVRNFESQDILEASQFAKLVWGDFYAQESPQLQKLIYDFTLSYYDLNRQFSFCVEDEVLKGFLLAHKKTDAVDIDFKNKTESLSDEKDKVIAMELFEYLEACGKKIKNVMNNDDVLMGLFVSVQKGCGKLLLSKLNEVCKEKGIKNIYLWTDTACDFEYYKKNKFDLVSESETSLNGKTIKNLIYKRAVE